MARRLIENLADVLPSFQLPEASAAHSRHYMPVGTLSEGREKTSLVFDAWADVGDRPMLIRWDAKLTNEETALFRQLANSLGYLGRSESWVEARLMESNELPDCPFNAFPCLDDEHPGREYEQLSLMAAIPPADYAMRQRELVRTAHEGLPLPEGTRPSARLLGDREKAAAPYPPDLFSCLTKDTAWWKQHGWSQPPGSRRVMYWRRADTLQVGVSRDRSPVPVRAVTTVLLAVTTPSGSRSALPACTRTLPQAELYHRAIVAHVCRDGGEHCPELTGRDDRGRPLTDGHRHAHVQPVDLDDDGRLDHVIIHAPMGLGGSAQRAVRRLRRTWTKGRAEALQLAVAGSGHLEILRSLRPPLNRTIEQLLGPTDGAFTWVSVTPFVPPRFLKRRGPNTLHGQIDAELISRRLPRVGHIEVLRTETAQLRHYVRRRGRGGGPPPSDTGFAVRLHFDEPIRPQRLITLGYASHYGLGLFRAETPAR